MTDFSPKAVAEQAVFTFDFTNDFATNVAAGVTIASAVVTCAVVTGTDASPSAMVSGVATISGLKVLQKIIGGVSGVYYALTCAATTSDGQVIPMTSNVMVQ